MPFSDWGVGFGFALMNAWRTGKCPPRSPGWPADPGTEESNLHFSRHARTFRPAFANGWLANTLGWGYYALIVVAALAAIPLYLVTAGGSL
jgi:hypothetical protein